MTDLDDLIRCHGRVATVVMNAPSNVTDAAQRFETHWQRARKQLASAGMPADGLSAMDDTVSGLHHGLGSSVVLVKCPDTETFVEFLDDEIGEDLVSFDTLPRLGALLESRQRSVPHVIVVADRAGADILAVDGGSLVEAVDVEGDTEYIHRGQPGGWSQRRYQQRAENTWEANAAQVADQVAKVARAHSARLVAVAGDVRAVAFLHDHLPKDLAAITRDLTGQSDEKIALETVRATADLVARDTREALGSHRDACGTGTGANGAAGTMRALAQGRVATLLVHDDPADERRASVDLDGLWCSERPVDRDSIPEGVEPTEARLVDVAIRCALRSDAEVRFVPRHGGPEEGIGAILRW